MKKSILLIGMMLCASMANAQSRCYILGDSIAQGVSTYSQECNSLTKVGLNTNDAKKFLTTKGVLHFDNLVISLGINDKGQPTQTWTNLREIREKVSAKKVIWILPNENHYEQNYLVKKMATKFGDSYVDITPVISKDKIHPTPEGYKIIADTLKKHY